MKTLVIILSLLIVVSLFVLSEANIPRLIYSERYASVKYYPERLASFTQDKDLPPATHQNDDNGKQNATAKMDVTTETVVEIMDHTESMDDDDDSDEKSAKLIMQTTTEEVEIFDTNITEIDKPPSIAKVEQVKVEYGSNIEDAKKQDYTEMEDLSKIEEQAMMKEIGKMNTTDASKTEEESVTIETVTEDERQEPYRPPSVESFETKMLKKEELVMTTTVESVTEDGESEQQSPYKPPSVLGSEENMEEEQEPESKKLDVESIASKNKSKEETSMDQDSLMKNKRVPERLEEPPHVAISNMGERDNSTDELIDLNENIPTTEPTFQVVVEDENKSEETEEETVDEGVFYLYHPHGLLQKIIYKNRADPQNMEYYSQYQYQDIEPITGPIYVYDPVTNTLHPATLK